MTLLRFSNPPAALASALAAVPFVMPQMNTQVSALQDQLSAGVRAEQLAVVEQRLEVRGVRDGPHRMGAGSPHSRAVQFAACDASYCSACCAIVKAILWPFSLCWTLSLPPTCSTVPPLWLSISSAPQELAQAQAASGEQAAAGSLALEALRSDVLVLGGQQVGLVLVVAACFACP